MKKIIILTSLALASGSLFAQNNYSASASTQAATVAQVEQWQDASNATLQGNIIEHLTGKNYLFKDKTGIVNIEIDTDKWPGFTFSPKEHVEIQGDVIRIWNSLQIKVNAIRKL
ncbi:YgiW/YdeI family stress tolerance OB fold protein [Neisseria sp. Ec49-e6-T10]|uniref:YgiW/YdeI family stress tolerance OB fold protein n=1 Tax=Neisseria sp. Ec49-e6-T10 TaxID=3140744 RepID=UPI003EB7C45F